MKKANITRLNILHKAYELIYINGYQTTSIDDILATTQVTKGAFYYHFKSKDEMGIAIIQEILQPEFISQITKILSAPTNPLDAIYNMISHLLSDQTFLKIDQGCPIANFIQEMAPKNMLFSKTLQQLTQEWQNIIVESLEKAKIQKSLNSDLPSDALAIFVISSYWGIRNFGRMESENKYYQAYLLQLKNYLNSLR
ncbi:TetR/AcrR family transcriptional regulator [Flavobacterium sp. HSC-61S13]|uniref:TetR/AcrR family transcriptional regulator n=1 Tax=Flavobacterium sp. HSC-61S13 TaxID=2910963 RepID=UPI0020A147BE|nr:TetR/AcrR family transcriptional regulator [Flavobacterium sp. HSC-61S13]MCP1995910.1 AcrR family transcriptional regulator [Flavobacterium sp. HSC-61S13]